MNRVYDTLTGKISTSNLTFLLTASAALCKTDDSLFSMLPEEGVQVHDEKNFVLTKFLQTKKFCYILLLVTNENKAEV